MNRNKIKLQKGFTLIETMIGLSILTIAIVTATSLLMGLIQSNRQITKTLQAHYLAQEGLEAVRNIRDTNWMRNRQWNGVFDIPDDVDEVKEYVLGFNSGVMNGSLNENADLASLSDAWNLIDLDSSNTGEIYLCGDSIGTHYFSTDCGEIKPSIGFKRRIEISKPVDCKEADADLALCGKEGEEGKAMLVRSIVTFDKGEAVLEEILTDWKGGAL